VADLLSAPCILRLLRQDSEMRWIRKNRRFGSWAAVFALTIQLVLSFGHIHPEDFQGSPALTASSSQANPGTSDDEDRGRGPDFCAICAALNLTSSSVLPTVALPAIPIYHPYKWTADLLPAQVFYRVQFLFQARAPPHSV
jgi:hypothetical protein